MNLEEFIELLDDVFEDEEGNIEGVDKFKYFDEWDSLAQLSLNAMINEEFDITIPKNDFENIETVEELFDYIQIKIK